MATKTSPAAETAKAKPEAETATKTASGWVTATLKSRHCMGGVCKEAGDEMRMTRGTYERLKKYGRVE